MERDFDVVIIGSGGAGLAAGMMAREAGASVMVLEADTKLGGATRISSAVVYACGTSVQKSRASLERGSARRSGAQRSSPVAGSRPWTSPAPARC